MLHVRGSFRIVEKVLLDPHESILERLLLQIIVPRLLGCYLEDHMRRLPCLANRPTSDMTMRNTFDHGNIGSDWIFFWIERLIKVEVLVDRTALLTEKPSKNLYKIVNEIAMHRRFPHQVLRRRVRVVVILHFVNPPHGRSMPILSLPASVNHSVLCAPITTPSAENSPTKVAGVPSVPSTLPTSHA